MKQNAALLTLSSISETKLTIPEIIRYCNERNMELNCIVQVSMERMIHNPESIYLDVKKANCDMIVCDDVRLLILDMNGIEHTLIDECKKYKMPYIHVSTDMEMNTLLLQLKYLMTPILCQQNENIHSVILYHGYEESYRENQDFLEMLSYVKSKLSQDENYGVMVYQEEECGLFESMRQLAASNPIEMLVMNEALITKEGQQFINEMETLDINCCLYEDIHQEITQGLWQIQ